MVHRDIGFSDEKGSPFLEKYVIQIIIIMVQLNVNGTGNMKYVETVFTDECRRLTKLSMSLKQTFIQSILLKDR